MQFKTASLKSWQITSNSLGTVKHITIYSNHFAKEIMVIHTAVKTSSFLS